MEGASKRRSRIVSLSPHIRCLASWQSGVSVADRAHIQLEESFAAAAAALDYDHVALVGYGSEMPPESSLRAIPTLRDIGDLPKAPTTWPAQKHVVRRFADDVLWALDELVASDEPLGPRDIVVALRAHPQHVLSAIRVGLALRGVVPIVLNLYQLHQLYRPAAGTGHVVLRDLLLATRHLRRVANVHLCVDSQRLAEMVQKDLGEALPVLPHCSPLEPVASDPSAPPPLPATRAPGVRARVTLLTSRLSRSKGYDLVVDLAERAVGKGLEIVVRDGGVGLDEVCMPTVAALRGGMRTVAAHLPAGSYRDLVAQSDVVLVPYRNWSFTTRPSLALADALHLRKPVVATAESSNADVIELLGAGRTFTDGDVDSLVAAVDEVVDHIDVFRARIERSVPAWTRRNNFEAFLRALIGVAGAAERRPLSTVARDAGLAELTAFELGWEWAMRARVAAGDAKRAARARFTGVPTGKLWLTTREEDRHPTPEGQTAIPYLPVLHWRTSGVERVDLRLDTPNGLPLLLDARLNGEAWGTWWIAKGRMIFLQDVSGGRALTEENTLACLPFAMTQASEAVDAWEEFDRKMTREVLLARVFDRQGPRGRLEFETMSSGSARITWDARGVAAVEVRAINLPGDREGVLFAIAAPSGGAETGAWVTLRTVFVLYEHIPDPSGGAGTRGRLLDHLEVGSLAGYPVAPWERLRRRWVLRNRPAVSARALPMRTADLDLARQIEGRIRRVIDEAVGPDELAFIPPPSSGEFFLLAAYAPVLLEKYGGKRLVLVGPRHFVDVLRLFPHSPVRGLPIATMDAEAHPTGARCAERGYQLRYGICATYEGIGPFAGQRRSFADVFFSEPRIPLSSPRLYPLVTEEVRSAALRQFRELGLVEGRTVILAPRARSVIPPPLAAWEHIAKVLTERGFKVVTNAVRNEAVVPGTVAFGVPYPELFCAVELGGFLLTARSGLCDVCSDARARMFILMDDRDLLTLPAMVIRQDLAANGFTDHAVYQQRREGEGALEYADRVLSHPDLRAPPRPTSADTSMVSVGA